MALSTVADFMRQARYLLQDAEGIRYTDAALIDALGNGIGEMRRMRPDIFFGITVPAITATTDLGVIPDGYRVTLRDYICGYAETSDQESADAGRAAMFRTRFAAQLTTAGVSA